MSFFSTNFVLFFGLFWLVSIFLKRYTLPFKVWFLAGSGYFFYTLNSRFLLVFGLAILANYGILLLIKFLKKESLKVRPVAVFFSKFSLFLGIILNLGLLVYFKYTNFFLDSILEYSQKNNFSWNVLSLTILAPAGLSFLTFRAIGNLVDFYKKPFKLSILDFSVFYLFFPHLVAGPIAKSKSFYEDLNTKEYSYNPTEVGILIFSGLFKKLVISSYLYSFYLAPIGNPQLFSAQDLAVAILVYSCYIYADFSGYSDLAIAFSKLLGINTPANFNQPYKSKTVTEFWGRWHISLSSFFREYVYFPLGGDGRGAKYFKTLVKCRNLILVMLLSGFWHGAGLNFLIWGGAFGVLMSVEAIFKKVFGKMEAGKFVKPLINFLGVVYTFTAVSLLWAVFVIKDTLKIETYFRGLFSSQVKENRLLDWRLFVVLGIILLGNLISKKYLDAAAKFLQKQHFILKLFLCIVLSYLVIRLSPELIPPFVYAQF